MLKKVHAFPFMFFILMFTQSALAASSLITISEIDFSDFLPITGSCEMDLSGQVTDFPGSQMCIASDVGTIAHFRISADALTNINIQINTRLPENSDGLTFTPVGKITSEFADVDIIPGQVHVVSSGIAGEIDIQFGGQIILSNGSAFSADTAHVIQMEKAIVWSEEP